MATEDEENVRRAEKFTLKRKLTGPPRLLLGKTRTRSVGEDRPEAQTNKDKTENTGGDESSLKYCDSITAELTETAIVVEGSRGRCGAAGEDDDITNRKVNRRRWWRRFSPAVVCNRKQKKDVEESSEKQQSDGAVPPEGALQETDAALLHNTNTEEENSKGKRRFNARTWPTFKRFLTSPDVRQTHKQTRDFAENDGVEPLMTFRKKLRNVFTKGGKKRSSGFRLENMEDTRKREEPPRSSEAHEDEPTGLHGDVTVGSLEVVTAEMSVQPTEQRAAAESLDETPAEDLVCDTNVTEEDSTDAVGGSETIQSDTNNVPVKDAIEVVFSAKDEVSTEVVLDAGDPPSSSTTSPQDASELHREEKTAETSSQSPQPSTDGPSIRIELVPPDDVTHEDEEEDEECWEGSSSSANHNHLLRLLGFDHSERQLVQTACSLVRAAMSAAVDQLTREQQSESDCVHRESQGCRDHA
ncbi:uncharacterized protein LOC122862656 [Siniperca chuatsi]|uniref:uncharacterized protein LOC122862656 n=1 Tax=Siniperca chuatsi TaxID=119488 RepID=UPI001CE11804|nr:uncharacterized protein LOC122862656 [Siniperca chuatsi]XP_044024132.1 uncharacterized protein LOC122862656 [Siniperca chuatsi]